MLLEIWFVGGLLSLPEARDGWISPNSEVKEGLRREAAEGRSCGSVRAKLELG